MCPDCNDKGIMWTRHKFKPGSEYPFRCWCDLGKPNPDRDDWICEANKTKAVPRWEESRKSTYIPARDYGTDEDLYWGLVRELPNIPSPKGLDEYFTDIVAGSVVSRAIKFKYKDLDTKVIYQDWKQWKSSVKVVVDESVTLSTTDGV